MSKKLTDIQAHAKTLERQRVGKNLSLLHPKLLQLLNSNSITVDGKKFIVSKVEATQLLSTYNSLIKEVATKTASLKAEYEMGEYLASGLESKPVFSIITEENYKSLKLKFKSLVKRDSIEGVLKIDGGEVTKAYLQTALELFDLTVTVNGKLCVPNTALKILGTAWILSQDGLTEVEVDFPGTNISYNAKTVTSKILQGFGKDIKSIVSAAALSKGGRVTTRMIKSADARIKLGVFKDDEKTENFMSVKAHTALLFGRTRTLLGSIAQCNHFEKKMREPHFSDSVTPTSSVNVVGYSFVRGLNSNQKVSRQKKMFKKKRDSEKIYKALFAVTKRETFYNYIYLISSYLHLVGKIGPNKSSDLSVVRTRISSIISLVRDLIATADFFLSKKKNKEEKKLLTELYKLLGTVQDSEDNQGAQASTSNTVNNDGDQSDEGVQASTSGTEDDQDDQGDRETLLK